MRALDYFIFVDISTIMLAGILGVLLWKKNVILMLLSIELIFIAILLGFVLTSVYLDDIFGIIFAMFGLGIIGAEAALALSFAILLYNLKNKEVTLH